MRKQLSFAFIRLSLLPNETNLTGSLILQMDFWCIIQDASCAIQNEEEVISATSNIDVTSSISSG